jgi:hypothetical protein
MDNDSTQIDIEIDGEFRPISFPAPLAVFLRLEEEGLNTDQDGDDIAEALTQPIVLVEKSRISGELYFTGDHSLADAIAYHENQEYAEDWAVECVYNTSTRTVNASALPSLFDLVHHAVTSDHTPEERLDAVLEILRAAGYEVQA